MTGETEFAMGAEAQCVDGSCGDVRRVLIDPATRTVTHLVIAPRHRRQPGRLVPVNLIDTTDGEIRLRCTLAEFDRLDPADEEDLVEGRNAGIGPAGARAPIGIPQPVQVVHHDVVPWGETEIRPGDRVHALDGEIGRVRGFLADPDGRHATHVLLEEGHIWGHKEVAIPLSAVTGADEGIRLNMTRKQIEDLPPVG